MSHNHLIHHLNRYIFTMLTSTPNKYARTAW
nr:MAG TPA: hypothetical protein [Caudoviricetes sp.]